MKVKKKLAGLVLVTVLLTGGSCYAENKENPIIAYTEYGYIRLNMPSVEKIDYFGRYFIQCSYSIHFKQYLPYGIPIISDEGNEYIWFEPLTNREIYIGNVKKSPNILSVDIKQLTNIKGGESSRVYSALQQNFPELLAEVRAANKTANEKYGQELDKGLAALASHDLEMTYTHFKRAYDKGCTSLQMLREMSLDCWFLGDYDKALEWDSKAIELYPSVRTYNERAWDNYLLGNNEQALADVNMALSLDGNYTAALDTRGCIYYELGQYDKAIADFDKAIQIKGDDGHNYFYRSKCYKALGEQEKATADFTQAKKLWPEASDEKLNFSFEQSKALARRSESRKLRHSRYQQDLKKLNDAIYVTNNASNFSKLDICEQNRVIINVVDAIRNNEPEDFYEEVIPQAVRINYENGTYQQQYEQLQAELGLNTPSVVANGTGPKIADDGTILEAPTTLPTDSSKEIYDLRQPNALLRYESEGSQYILTYEDPMITYRALKGNEVTPIEQEHGRYMLRHVVEYGDPYPDFSFDYNSSSHTFTLYGGAGAKRTVHYDPATDTITVNHLNAAYSDLSGTYVYVPADDSYILYPRNHKLEANAVALAKEPFNGDSDIGKHYTVYYGPAIDLEVIAYPEYKEQRPNLPAMWYKMTNVEYPSEWIAFTYDKSKNIFTMYSESNDDNLITSYAYRRFRDASHIETANISSSNFGADDGVYVRDSDGTYRMSSHSIYKYITDGMFNFMHYVKK